LDVSVAAADTETAHKDFSGRLFNTLGKPNKISPPFYELNQEFPYPEYPSLRISFFAADRKGWDEQCIVPDFAVRF